MRSTLPFRTTASLVTLFALSACASGSERYPDLNLREFERVQGSFTSASSAAEPTEPVSISAKSLSEIEDALALAAEQHAKFVVHASDARPLVTSAAGTGIEDNRWPVAQIEIAALESRNGEIASLIADLDELYADATLSFVERERIDAARKQIAGYHASERAIIAELISVLAGPERP